MRPASKLLPLAILLALQSAQAQELGNWLDDPFEQATHGVALCPVPLGPFIAKADVPRREHDRAERGTTCWNQGRCILPNSYRYDKPINEAVVRGIRTHPEFANTSVWVFTQRRVVFLQGCVQSPQQQTALEKQAYETETVQLVISQLMLGTDAAAPYGVLPR